MEIARSNRLMHFRRPGKQKLIELLASLPCVTYELDTNLTILMVSANIADLLGIRPELVQGNRALWYERFSREDRDRLKARLGQADPNALVSETHKIINDDGLPVWVAHSLWKVGLGSNPHIRGAMIPLPAETCTQLFDNNLISQFVHKIGNHFQLINLLIGSLRRNGVASGEVDALQETVERAVEFTRCLSHYTQGPGAISEVDLGLTLHSVIQSVSPLFAEKKVILRLPVNSALDGIFVAGDPSLLEIAFRSILDNALDATNSGDCVTIDFKREKPGMRPASIAWISITDTGHGMGKATLQKAATPFFSSKPDRNGLGLTMAIRIVEMYGGLLNFSSEEEHGTRVDIVLPISRAAGQTTANSI